jgi:hypothetical protein
MASKCEHIPSMQLIWGLPGTGKTKTVAVMLLSFLSMKKNTLVCAPSNVAIKEVASCNDPEKSQLLELFILFFFTSLRRHSSSCILSPCMFCQI